MFNLGDMGVVVEKESDVVCIYGTNNTNSNILCAVPLCHPKYLKGLTYQISFYSDNVATVSVGDIMVYIDYRAKKCSNNRDETNYGSDTWGQDVSEAWNDVFAQRFQ
ncbi:MAG: hypothetical protein RR954_07570 [Christensenellaceae bacterium]